MAESMTLRLIATLDNEKIVVGALDCVKIFDSPIDLVEWTQDEVDRLSAEMDYIFLVSIEWHGFPRDFVPPPGNFPTELE